MTIQEGHDIYRQAKTFQLVADIVNSGLQDDEIDAVLHMVAAFRSIHN